MAQQKDMIRMKLSKNLVVFALMTFVFLFALALPVFAQDPVAIVNTGTLNVRSGPGLQYGSIATLPKGFGVALVARNEEGNWVYIALTNGVTGWVNVNYLYTQYPVRSLPVGTFGPAIPLVPTGTVTGAFNLNVRSSPDPNGQVIAVAGLGQTFELLGRSYDANWAKIRLAGGIEGWVDARYITTSVPVRSVSPADGSVWAPPPPTNYQPPVARHHVIRAGETLGSIAQRYGVNLYALAAANGIINLDRIYAGQRLIIP